jgi:hypothetical protein
MTKKHSHSCSGSSTKDYAADDKIIYGISDDHDEHNFKPASQHRLTHLQYIYPVYQHSLYGRRHMTNSNGIAGIAERSAKSSIRRGGRTLLESRDMVPEHIRWLTA